MRIEPTTLVEPTLTIDTITKSRLAQEDRLQTLSSVETATWKDKTQAFLNIWKSSGSVDEVLKFISRPFEDESIRREDSEFKQMMGSTEFAVEFAASYNGATDGDFVEAIRTSPNLKFAQALGADRLERENQQVILDKTISAMTQKVAFVVGSYLDLDVLVSGGLSLASKSRFIVNGIKARTLVGAEFGTYTFATVANLSEDIHYNSNDAALDFLIGAAIGIPLFKMAGSKRLNVNKIADARRASVTEQGELFDIIKSPHVSKNDNVAELTRRRKSLEVKIKDGDKTLHKDLLKVKQDIESVKTKKTIDRNIASYAKKEDAIEIKNTYKRSQPAIELMKIKFNDMFTPNTPKFKKNLAELEKMVNKLILRKSSDADYIKIEVDKVTGKLKDNKNFKLRERKDGSFRITYQGKEVGRKIPIAVAISVVGATTAQAGDDGDEFDIGSYLIIGILAAFGGAKLIKEISEAGGVKELFSNTASTISRKARTAKVEASERAYTENVEAIGEKVRIGAFEAYTSIAKEGPEAKKLADILVENVSDGRVDNISAIAANIERKFTNRFAILQKKLYYKFVRTEEVGYRDRIVSSIFSTGIKHEFNKSAGEVLRDVPISGKFSDEGIKLINEFATEQRKLYDELKEIMNENNMAMGKVDNYMPRLMNPEVYSLLRQADEATISKIKNAFSDMIYTKQVTKNANQADTQANGYIEGLMRTDLQGSATPDSVLLDMIDQVKRSGDGVEGSEAIIKDLVDRLGDKSKHTKARIDFNMEDFPEMKGMINGKEIDITIDQLFDLDTHTTFDRYTRAMSGHIAFAQKGYGRIAKFDDELNVLSRKHPSAAKKLDTVKRLILGESILDPSKGSVQMVTVAKNVAIGLALPLVAASLVPEIIKTALRSGGNYAMFKQGMHELVSFVKRDPNSELAEQLMNWTGHGNSRHNTNVGYKGFSDISNEESMMSGTVQSLSAGFRNSVLNLSQLLRTNDYMHRLNMVGNTETLAKWLNGKNNLTPLEIQKFGFTDATKKLLGGQLDLTELGNLKKIDDSGWNKTQRREMIRVLNNMEQRYVQESTMGASALWTKDSTFGKLMGTLLSFPMTAHANHGVMDAKGALTGDLNSMMNTAIWYSGSYMSIKLKAEIQNKDFDEEQAMKQAILMMPLFGVESVVMSLSRGGVIPSMSQNGKDLIDVFGDTNE